MSKKKDFNVVNVKPHFLLLGFLTDMNTCDMALKNILMCVKNVTNRTKMFIQHVQALSRIERKSSFLVENVIKSTPRRLASTFTSTVSTRTSETLNVLFVIKLLVVPRLLVHITDNATTFKLVPIVKSRWRISWLFGDIWFTVTISLMGLYFAIFAPRKYSLAKQCTPITCKELIQNR